MFSCNYSSSFSSFSLYNLEKKICNKTHTDQTLIAKYLCQRKYFTLVLQKIIQCLFGPGPSQIVNIGLQWKNFVWGHKNFERKYLHFPTIYFDLDVACKYPKLKLKFTLLIWKCNLVLRFCPHIFFDENSNHCFNDSSMK
jgi:hypothetical protein